MNDFLDDWIKNLSTNILNNIIYKDGSNYVLFEKYYVTKKDNYYQVLRNTDETCFEFSKLKNAASWAILDRHNKIIEANRVLELDQKISSLLSEMEVHKRLQKQGQLELREINRDKYLVNIDKQRQFQWELDKYIILAKRCQNKGYQNELTRTARK